MMVSPLSQTDTPTTISPTCSCGARAPQTPIERIRSAPAAMVASRRDASAGAFPAPTITWMPGRSPTMGLSEAMPTTTATVMLRNLRQGARSNECNHRRAGRCAHDAADIRIVRDRERGGRSRDRQIDAFGHEKPPARRALDLSAVSRGGRPGDVMHDAAVVDGGVNGRGVRGVLYKNDILDACSAGDRELYGVGHVCVSFFGWSGSSSSPAGERWDSERSASAKSWLPG